MLASEVANFGKSPASCGRDRWAGQHTSRPTRWTGAWGAQLSLVANRRSEFGSCKQFNHRLNWTPMTAGEMPWGCMLGELAWSPSPWKRGILPGRESQLARVSFRPSSARN